MAVRTSFTAGEVLAAADLTDTFGAKLNLAGGKVLQIVRATDTTYRATTSTSFVDVTGMSVTITPQKSNSAILIMVIGQATPENGTVNICGMKMSITDSSNNAISGAESFQLNTSQLQRVSGQITQFFSPVCLVGRATPATTSAVTFKLRFLAMGLATNAAFLNNETTGQIYAIEVSA